MKMIFSVPKPKPIPQIQVVSISNEKIIQNTNIINPFTNIFSRLTSSGPCKSCG